MRRHAAWLIALGSLPWLVSACRAEPLNLTLLQEYAIKLQESEGERLCGIAHGKDGEIGCYQFKPGTARQIGFDDPSWKMWLPENQRAIASEIIRQCAARRWRYPLMAIAVCYNQGLRAPVGKGHDGFAYGQEVAMRYYAELMARAKRDVLPRR